MFLSFKLKDKEDFNLFEVFVVKQLLELKGLL